MTTYEEEIEARIRFMWGSLGEYICHYEIVKKPDLRWHKYPFNNERALQQLWLIKVDFDRLVWIDACETKFDMKSEWFYIPTE